MKPAVKTIPASVRRFLIPALILILTAAGILFGLSEIFSPGLAKTLSSFPFYGGIGLAALFGGAAVFALSVFLLHRGKPLHVWFTWTALPLLLLFLFLIPPMSTPDERAHFNSAYDIACKLYQVPETKDSYYHRVRPADTAWWSLKLHVDKPADYEEIYTDFFRTLPKKDAEFSETIVFEQNGSSPAYVLPALMMVLGFALRFPFARLAVFAALPNVLICLFGMREAIRRTPAGKAPMALLALLPISLQQGASLSYDAMLLPAAFLVTAIGMKWAGLSVGLSDLLNGVRFEKKYRDSAATRSDIILFVLCVLALGQLKEGVCLPLVLIWPLLCIRKGMLHRLPKPARIAVPVVLAVLLLLWLWPLGGADRIWHMFNDKPYLFYAFQYGRSPAFYLTHPDVLFPMIQKTIQKEGRDIIYQAFGGRLGWLNLYANHYISYTLVLVFLLLLFRSKNEPETFVWTPVRRIVLILCGGLPCLLSAAAMLLFHTTPDSDQILGIQGRYFLPAMLPALLGIFRWKMPVRRFLTDRLLLTFALFLSWISILSSYGFLN